MSRFALLLVLVSVPSFGQDVNLSSLSRSFEKIADHVSSGVVQIVARRMAQEESSGSVLLRGQRSSGSGVIVDAEGYVITNAHVVGPSRRVQVLVPLSAEGRMQTKSVIKPAGKLVEAQVIGLDRETDIAVLKIDHKGLRPLPFGDSEALRQGQLVFACGSPFGLENTVTLGIISSPARQIRSDHPMIYIQTDAPINPGNSGGPLIDTNGAIIGINTFILSSSGSSAGVGFAAPSNIVRSVYEQLRKSGRVRRGQIGVQAQTITPELAGALKLTQDWGVIIGDVAPSGAAEAAGLEVGDIVLTLNGKVLENARQFGVNIYQRAGETVTVELLRGGQNLTRQIAVLERPRDMEETLSAVGDGSPVVKLGILALDVDAKVTPVLPPLRRLSGVVVSGVVSEPSGRSETLFPADVIYAVNGTKVSSVAELNTSLESLKPGESAALQLERLGQLQYVVIEIQ